MLASFLGWTSANPVVSHCLIGLALMAVVSPLLRALGNPSSGWYAAAFVSVYFYAREAAQAERALKPTLGQPASFFLTVWPGNWGPGGARLSEWLAPALLTLAVAWLMHRRR